MFKKITLITLCSVFFCALPWVSAQAIEDDDIISSVTLLGSTTNQTGGSTDMTFEFTSDTTITTDYEIYVLFFNEEDEVDIQSATAFNFSEAVYSSSTMTAIIDVNSGFSPFALLRPSVDLAPGTYGFSLTGIINTTVDGAHSPAMSTATWSPEMKATMATKDYLVGDIDKDEDGEIDDDWDSDGDGIPDNEEDLNGDGIPDDEQDEDGDGIPDNEETEPDKPKKKYLKVKNKKKKSAKLKWKAVTNADFYKVRLEKKKKKKYKKKKVYKNVTKVYKKIKKKRKLLKPGKRYRFKVKACNDQGCSKWSKKKKFKMKG